MAAFLAPLLGTGISALAGLFGAKKKQVQTNTQDSTSTSTPNLSPQQNALIQQIMAGAQNQFNQSADLKPFEAQGLQNIGRTSDLQSKTVSNLLASRGLSFSPAAAAQLANANSNKLNQQSQFENQIPLLQRSLQSDSLNNLMKTFGLLPTSVTSTTHGTSTGTGQTQENPVAAALSGAGAALFSGGQDSLLQNLFRGGGSFQTSKPQGPTTSNNGLGYGY